MFRRGLTGVAMAVVILFAMGSTVVFADTSGGNDVNVYFVYANDETGPVPAGVTVQLGTIDGVKLTVMEVGTSTYKDITCKGKHKTGELITNVNGRDESAVIKVDRKLATASASATMTMVEDTYNSCTGVETQRETHGVAVSLDLHAVTGVTTTRNHSVTTYPDGSRETFDGRFDSRQAVGTFHVGGTAHSADEGQIQHNVSTYVVTPPRQR